MKKQLWGEVDNQSVYLITLSNGILQAEITNFGAALVSLMVPDQDGKPVDVVLGLDSLAGYLRQKCYLGVVVGRCANRIKNSRFQINGETYFVEPNEGPNHLHGGSRGFWTVPWDVESIGEDFVVMKYFSPDGDGGYPGNLECRVEYRLVDRQLEIRYRGISDKDTVLNLTNHSYFNLTGSGNGTIDDHLVRIAADQYTEIGPDSCSTGKILPLAGTPMDLSETHRIGDLISADHEQMKYGSGFDLNYVLSNREHPESPIADAFSPLSGIGMQVITDMEGMHFYTGNHLDVKEHGKNGASYTRRGALCFETQHFPDAVNISSFPSPILKKGETMESRTIFRFYNK